MSRFACIARQGRLRRRSCCMTSTTTPGRTQPRRRTSRARSTSTTTSWQMTSSFPPGIPGTSTRSTPAVSITTAPARPRARMCAFYDNASGLPGSQVAERTNLSLTDSGGSFVIPIPSDVTLGAGTYWVSVQANMDFGCRWPVGLRRPHRPERRGSCLGEPGRRLRRLPELGHRAADLRHRSWRSGSGLPPERDDRRPTTSATTSATTATASASTGEHYTISTQTGQSIVPGTTNIGSTVTTA